MREPLTLRSKLANMQIYLAGYGSIVSYNCVHVYAYAYKVAVILLGTCTSYVNEVMGALMHRYSTSLHWSDS